MAVRDMCVYFLVAVISAVRGLDVTVAPTNVTASLGTDATIPCLVANVQLSDGIKWKLNNGRVISDKSVSTNNNKYRVDGFYNLTILNVDTNDNGAYICAAGSYTLTGYLTVNVILADLRCNFDHDLCQWTQVAEPQDDLDWRRHSGPTETLNSGPTEDHTTKTGFYMYLEASPTMSGQRAQLISPGIPFHDHETQCLSFWYHMFGTDIGSLNVYTVIGGQLGVLIWTKSGSQDNDWLEARVNMTLGTTTTLQIMIEAVAGNGFKGDIALDDVTLSNHTCNDSGDLQTSTKRATAATTTTATNVSKGLTSSASTTIGKTEDLLLDIITVDGEEYIKLPRPCSNAEHLCPQKCNIHIEIVNDGTHCFDCICPEPVLIG